MSRTGLVRLLLAGGIVGPIVFVVLFIILGFVQPGYDPIQEHVSRLAFTRYGWLQTLNFVGCGALLVGFGSGLIATRKPERSLGAGLALVAVGAGLVIAGIYPSDIEHFVGSILAWFGLTAVCLAAGLRVASRRQYGLAACALGSAVIVFAFFWLAGQERLGDNYIGNIAGLTQRISIITGMAVVLLLAIAARRAQATAPET